MQQTKQITTKQKQEIYQLAKDTLTLTKDLMITTEDLSPINYAEEKNKFFNQKNYNPYFTYKHKKIHDINKPIIELSKRLEKLVIPEDLKNYFYEYFTDLREREGAIRAIGTNDFQFYMQKLYNWKLEPFDKFIKRIPEITFNEEAHPKLYHAEQMRSIFLHYMERYLGITEYLVHVDGFNDHMIRVGTKRLTIGKSIKRNANNVRRLIVHELESHILQRHNIQLYNNPLLKLSKLSDRLLFSEGIAVYNEIKTKTITHSSFETYHMRYKAVTMINKSFHYIFTHLAKEISEQKAFQITYRVKRGLGDTSAPGGFPKDAGYLLGLAYIYEYLEKGGDYSFLYLTRIPRIGELLRKYDLFEMHEHKVPQYHKDISLRELLK